MINESANITGRYTSMYGAMHGDVLLLGGSLDDIRRVIREVKE